MFLGKEDHDFRVFNKKLCTIFGYNLEDGDLFDTASLAYAKENVSYLLPAEFVIKGDYKDV